MSVIPGNYIMREMFWSLECLRQLSCSSLMAKLANQRDSMPFHTC